MNTMISEISHFDPERVLTLARDHSDEGRSRLSEEVAQIFQSELTDTERKLACDIMLTLLQQAELNLREALAERLSVLSSVPRSLIKHLGDDEVSVAEHVLMHSPVLTDPDLMEVIERRTEGHWRAIAQRRIISERVVDCLVNTGDARTVLYLLENETLHFNDDSLRKLRDLSMNTDVIQEPLLRRPEVDNNMAIELYLCVSQEIRKQILDQYNVNSVDLDRALKQIVQEMVNTSQGNYESSEEMVSLAERFKERNEITGDMLIKTLRRGQAGFFFALFATWLGVSPKFVRVLAEKEGGKHLAAACRAAGILKSEFASIFLLTRSLRQDDRIVDQAELAVALKSFDKIKPEAARKVLVAWSDGLEQ